MDGVLTSSGAESATSETGVEVESQLPGQVNAVNFWCWVIPVSWSPATLPGILVAVN